MGEDSPCLNTVFFIASLVRFARNFSVTLGFDLSYGSPGTNPYKNNLCGKIKVIGTYLANILRMAISLYAVICGT